MTRPGPPSCSVTGRGWASPRASPASPPIHSASRSPPERPSGPALLAQHPGRTGEDEVTVFESFGLAAQDILSARYLHDRALELGVGVTAELFDTDSPATALGRRRTPLG
ncbi:MAG TPA: hypothetical protein VGO16_02395 [Pseudonocardiaceae bacterium]|nr:hypothetical protein [Pseudonocardiaceae bacterium]